jgi:hypothetical protein
VKYWYTWISNTTSITGESLVCMNIKHYKYKWWNIDIQCFTIYTCSVWYLCISMFHQLYLYCLIFMYINVSPVIPVVLDIHELIYMNIKHYNYNWSNPEIHEYQTLQVYLVKPWYKWISNTTSITGETLRYMNISHYKYNWWNSDIHEYQTLQV